MISSRLRRFLHLEGSLGSRRFLAVNAAVLGGVTLLLLALGRLWAGASELRVMLLLSSFGLSLACALTALQLGFVARFRRTVRWAVASVVVSQIAYHVLVWSGWKTQSLPWRAWWLFMIASVALTLVLLLRAAEVDGSAWPRRVALAATAILASALAGLAFRIDLLGPVSPPVRWLLGLSAPVAVAACMVVCWQRWRRAVRLRGRRGRDVSTRGEASTADRPSLISPGWRRVLLALSHLAVLVLGLYAGRTGQVSTTTVTMTGTMPTALAHLSEAEIDAQMETDLRQLQTVVAGLEALESEMKAHLVLIEERLDQEGREYLEPHEDDELRWYFVTYLSYRTALLRLVTTYAGFEALRDPDQRARCFTLGYAAGLTAYRSALDLVATCREQSIARRKLNEPEPAWGVPAGMFDRIYQGASSDRRAELCEEMAAYLEHRLPAWRADEIWPAEDLAWLEDHVRSSLEAARAQAIDRHRRWLDLVLEKVRQDAYTPVYSVQAMVAEWIGDIRLLDRPRFVDRQAIETIKPLLRPGDILLERRSWSASNAFLPGFWPHAALYVGTIDDLRALGIADHPEVRMRLESYLAPGPGGDPYTVIEALAEGVIFNTVEHSLHADYVAVLRPRLDEQQISSAIVNAFRHQGKPYDFEFDFFTSDRLVCTELIYRSYRDLLDLDLRRVMGRDTLPALDLVHKFARERGAPDQELDLVVFLDGDPVAGKAFPGSEEAFIASAERQREFNEEMLLPAGRSGLRVLW